LTGADLLCALYEDESVTPVTLRAELARLRQVLDAGGAGTAAPGLLASRPYRLTEHVESDLAVVERRLAAGAVTDAPDSYPGPVLASSQAPAVHRHRRRAADGLRASRIA